MSAYASGVALSGVGLEDQPQTLGTGAVQLKNVAMQYAYMHARVGPTTTMSRSTVKIAGVLGYALKQVTPWDEQQVDTGALQASRNLGIIPSLAKPVLLAANSLGNKLTDLALDFAPNTVDRSTVRTIAFAARCKLVVYNLP